MTLRPEKTTQKALISTTSHFVGEYETDGVLLTIAWPSFGDQAAWVRWSEGPASRSAFVYAFETEPIDDEAQFRDYSPTGEVVCSYLSVLYGKRFDSHGLLEGMGHSHVPDLTQYWHLCDHRLPQNSHQERVDYPTPLVLGELSRMERLILEDAADLGFLRTFQGAAKFYLQALQNFEDDPEVAYLHLITAGEILSNFHEYEKEQLLDSNTKRILSLVQEHVPNGDRVASVLSRKLRQVKRRFVETVMQLVDETFFERSEASDPSVALRADRFRSSVAAAYDLRSRYVHTGVPFGRWVSSAGPLNAEVQVGRPVVADAKLAAALERAPTYVGLERVIRYCLLRFAQMNDVYKEPGTESETDA